MEAFRDNRFVWEEISVIKETAWAILSTDSLVFLVCSYIVSMFSFVCVLMSINCDKVVMVCPAHSCMVAAFSSSAVTSDAVSSIPLEMTLIP